MSAIPAVEIHNRQRLGWFFLLTGFAIFLAIAISVPLLVNNYLQNSVEPLATAVQANQGTVGIDSIDGSRRAALQGQGAQEVGAGSTILTDATATALLTVFPPDGGQLLSRLQIYGNTTIRLTQSDTPRFDWSDNDQNLTLELDNGRVQMTVPPSTGRPLTIRIDTPHGQVHLREPGQYAIEVINIETQVSVLSGQAALVAGSQPFLLLADERAVIPIGGEPEGPFTTRRNLIRNGAFDNLFDRWTLYTWIVELPDQPKGEAVVTAVAGEPTLRVVRNGQGHADVKIRQILNQDVSDFDSLRLQITFRVVEQSLSVCGTLGSECPLFIKLNYLDPNGVSQIWQHGFYAYGEVNPDTSPDGCISCAVVQSAHERVTLGQITFYDVELAAEFARQGALPPKFIESVELAFLGHSFEVEVVDVALMAEE